MTIDTQNKLLTVCALALFAAALVGAVLVVNVPDATLTPTPTPTPVSMMQSYTGTTTVYPNDAVVVKNKFYSGYPSPASGETIMLGDKAYTVIESGDADVWRALKAWQRARQESKQRYEEMESGKCAYNEWSAAISAEWEAERNLKVVLDSAPKENQ